MSDTEREEGRASSRVAELTKLEGKIQQAAALIGELRETNYSLNGEVAELRRELQSLSEGRAPDVSPDGSADGGGASSHAELDALRKERKAIRSKVALLLERIEKLEP